MSAYVPVTVEVRDKYMEWWIDGEYVGQSSETGEEFDAWLQSVKADAWDEGFDSGHYAADWESRDCDCRANPYRGAND